MIVDLYYTLKTFQRNSIHKINSYLVNKTNLIISRPFVLKNESKNITQDESYDGALYVLVKTTVGETDVFFTIFKITPHGKPMCCADDVILLRGVQLLNILPGLGQLCYPNGEWVNEMRKWIEGKKFKNWNPVKFTQLNSKEAPKVDGILECTTIQEYKLNRHPSENFSKQMETIFSHTTHVCVLRGIAAGKALIKLFPSVIFAKITERCNDTILIHTFGLPVVQLNDGDSFRVPFSSAMIKIVHKCSFIGHIVETPSCANCPNRN